MIFSWSTSGGLLASGSDDTQLNIWEYNPAGLAKSFTLKDSISTGHHANIFSVKFMPHSGDRRVVSCAGDSEVRVFDLEYSERTPNESSNAFSSSTRSRRFSDFFPNARWLSDANTNARVYRSHADRAKRIVTESSPHLFLTCSEDGEVSPLPHMESFSEADSILGSTMGPSPTVQCIPCATRQSWLWSLQSDSRRGLGQRATTFDILQEVWSRFEQHLMCV
jgi:WD40 repeat protein